MPRLTSVELSVQLRGLWTQGDIAARVGLTPMAVYCWTQRAKDPLPYVSVPGFKKHGVRFVPSEVRAWCRRKGFELQEEDKTHGKRKRVALRRAA